MLKRACQLFLDEINLESLKKDSFERSWQDFEMCAEASIMHMKSGMMAPVAQWVIFFSKNNPLCVYESCRKISTCFSFRPKNQFFTPTVQLPASLKRRQSLI